MVQLGLRVYVLDRNQWPLSRQLGERVGLLLHQLLADLRIDVVLGAQAARVLGGE